MIIIRMISKQHILVFAVEAHSAMHHLKVQINEIILYTLHYAKKFVTLHMKPSPTVMLLVS